MKVFSALSLSAGSVLPGQHFIIDWDGTQTIVFVRKIYGQEAEVVRIYRKQDKVTDKDVLLVPLAEIKKDGIPVSWNPTSNKFEASSTKAASKFLLSSLGFQVANHEGGGSISLMKGDRTLYVSQLGKNEEQSLPLDENEDNYVVPNDSTKNVFWSVLDDSGREIKSDYFRAYDFSTYEKAIRSAMAKYLK